MILRRILAALVLVVFAIGSALYWNDWRFDLRVLSINLIVACVGFLVLHRRWKRREARILTPDKAKDIFS